MDGQCARAVRQLRRLEVGAPRKQERDGCPLAGPGTAPARHRQHGPGERVGHPHGATLALLARARVPLLRTDQAGTITVTTDGKQWEVACHRREAEGPVPGEVQDGAAPRPEVGGSPEVESRPAARIAPSLLNLNTATLGELESLPGIGPVLARRIVEARPYRSVDDLGRVEGIGRVRLASERRSHLGDVPGHRRRAADECDRARGVGENLRGRSQIDPARSSLVSRAGRLTGNGLSGT